MSKVRSMIEDMRNLGKILQCKLTKVTADADADNIKIICDYVRSRVNQSETLYAIGPGNKQR
jgi:hypothetical protein